MDMDKINEMRDKTTLDEKAIEMMKKRKQQGQNQDQDQQSQ